MTCLLLTSRSSLKLQDQIMLTLRPEPVSRLFSWRYSAYPPAYVGSFPHPQHYFAAAGENEDFVIAVINFQLNQCFENFFATYLRFGAPRF